MTPEGVRIVVAEVELALRTMYWVGLEDAARLCDRQGLDDVATKIRELAHGRGDEGSRA